jgi:NAD(P)-dependent dehydrogenase (short-subunit alcohol dehydrogenase family)
VVLRLDVEDLESIAQAVEAGIKKFGKIDVLLNNAGYSAGGIFEALSREAIKAHFEVNVFGEPNRTHSKLQGNSNDSPRSHGCNTRYPPTFPGQ